MICDKPGLMSGAVLTRAQITQGIISLISCHLWSYNQLHCLKWLAVILVAVTRQKYQQDNLQFLWYWFVFSVKSKPVLVL